MLFLRIEGKKLITMKFVEKITNPKMRNATAVCVRSSYKLRTGVGLTSKKDQFFVIEVREDKYNEILENPGNLIPEPDLLMLRIMYHELMHCLLDRGHLPVSNNKYRNQLMSPSYIKTISLEKNWDKMMEENFSEGFLSDMPIID